MRKIDALRAVRTKPELALLLGIKASALTYLLYVLKPSTQYARFEIPKKSGGTRTIFAPSERLKAVQSSLSILLQDCIEEINKAKPPRAPKGRFAKNEGKTRGRRAKRVDYVFTSTLSHGFVRKRSIITNALMHLGKKNVLNIDINNFFDSFNFGRVRGFFITNNNFRLDPNVATVLAQIACYDNKLPQGSPCSPVITNLIAHSLDIRLAALAKKNSCTYSRYADDITFSTRKNVFPIAIAKDVSGSYECGLDIEREIIRAGFKLNAKKTRVQYKDSRQDVTGLVVNEKPNVKSEYWRTVKSQCHSLFRTGEFVINNGAVSRRGTLFELEGRLNFIDQVDYYNRLRQKLPLNREYALADHKLNTRELLSGRERTFSRFLYYRHFYANDKPVIICEGQTDNIYIRSAIHSLAAAYPRLANVKTPVAPYKLLISLFGYSERTKFLLQLYGGANYLKSFIEQYERHYGFYQAPKPKNPVIIMFDNDSGFGTTENFLKGKSSAVVYPVASRGAGYRHAEFIHVIHNLYIVLTPLGGAKSTAIEDLFLKSTLDEKVSGKKFNPDKNIDTATEYGKEVFAKKVILAKKGSIDFSGFSTILNRTVQCIEHYDSIK
ncbi:MULTISPECIES: retron Ec67 family RNA-directed DNA polymerase/endonuclease [unclassified Pseudomonas]|uniref:retron Ec67 family RNA-directed DNA polymerase/endonuclease n=1 Tax=unclassified Pseudomonas TaxID=196821 RepID=UPI0009DE7C54|nr:MULTISPECIES: retron Ec67 family RNA-directed DNA polymerase/endonuclease [unclassified Pseudomonas]RAS27608.1 reverse transcriptase (RNA-dependent DNA polymerase) [Pseudomonas sp. URMO17WK12:I7]SMF48979.1 RNA-directed DNA polymerase [Pseudomonas sp. URMO17WK12:I5]